MTDRPSMFHDSHRALQDRFDGRRVADALEKHRRLAAFGADETAFIEAAEFFFLATAHGGSVDCSFKGGPAGFVRVTGPTSLEWTDIDGNSMYRSLGNILGSPRAGLLFIRFGAAPRRLRVNGACRLIETGPKLTIRLEADEIFPNCPRYIPDMARLGASDYLPDDAAGGAGKKPSWKSLPQIAPALPANDPHKG